MRYNRTVHVPRHDALIRKSLTFAVIVLLVSQVLITAVSFAGEQSIYCEIFSHLRPVWCFMALVLLASLIVLKHKIGSIVSLILFLINLAPIAMLYIPESHQASDDQNSQHIRLLQMNVEGGKNHNYKAALELIKEYRPDIVGFSEITETWLKNMEGGLPDFPYRVAEPYHGGIGVFSRLPLRDAKIEYFGTIRRPRVFTRVNVGEKTITLFFAHPVIPLRGSREADLAETAREIHAESNPTILAGDLNCTPWSYYFDKLKRDGALHDSEQGFGFQPSWCTFWPIALFPIDHCLMTKQFSTTSRNICKKIGSDHFPVYTEMVLHSGN